MQNRSNCRYFHNEEKEWERSDRLAQVSEDLNRGGITPAQKQALDWQQPALGNV